MANPSALKKLSQAFFENLTWAVALATLWDGRVMSIKPALTLEARHRLTRDLEQVDAVARDEATQARLTSKAKKNKRPRKPPTFSGTSRSK